MILHSIGICVFSTVSRPHPVQKHMVGAVSSQTSQTQTKGFLLPYYNYMNNTIAKQLDHCRRFSKTYFTVCTDIFHILWSTIVRLCLAMLLLFVLLSLSGKKITSRAQFSGLYSGY